ncbi:putative gustatory receptor clone PTE03 [Periophthalmus magnuspinnatus]|uniref:putative gustatory receptor clone PTE03 n=1 Tax=Periophthalmus magnuspinnatus TaxID=409849 RepID=UPI00145C0528|nr:putative gustatory receptor clone PTE03 [Periophthalmus magnuspinnatus]
MASANVSSSSSLTLAAYWDLGSLRSLWFLLLLLLYVAVLGCNLVVIAAIFVDRSLHQPMYVLICNLLTNQLCGSVAIYPFLLFQLLQSTHAVSHAACLVQVFFLFFYGNVQIMTLAAMSYDRYVAICCPLQYHRRMSSQRTLRLLLLVWLLPLLEVSFMVSLSAPLRLCGNHISKVYCDNYSVVKLACGDTTLNNVYGLIYTCVALLSVPALILYTYVRIIRVCLSSGASTRRKALSTCAPHLASLLNVTLACFCEVVMTRFNVTAVPNAVRVVMSLYFITCPPLFDPLVYGLALNKVRRSCRALLLPWKH